MAKLASSDGNFDEALKEVMRSEVEGLILRLYKSCLSDQDCADVTEAFYSAKYSKSTISSITDALEEDVKDYKARSIDGDWFVIFLDSTYVPLRQKTVQRAAIMQEFMSISEKPDPNEALKAYGAFVTKWGLLYKGVKEWAEGIDPDEMFAFYGFPAGLRRKIYTNNCIEGFNKEIKRMIKKHIQFVDEEAEEKVLVSIFLHYDERVGKRPIRGKELIEEMEKKD
jgi:transposase-like protein